jgi:hypothetical protein
MLALVKPSEAMLCRILHIKIAIKEKMNFKRNK